jgi:GNAT superfamily N-acetyltransferase
VSDSVVFRVDTASAEEIAQHLGRCDASFVPPLGSRVDIAEYAHKLFTRAVRFEAWDGRLVALLAAYCNDARATVGFITSVSVEPAWRGREIASRLLEQCVRHVRERGFERIELEVDAGNASALGLYARHGFRRDGREDRTITMCLELGKEAR